MWNRRDVDSFRLAVVSPWGAGGGYSGPLVFMDRLFNAVKASWRGPQALEIHLLARDRGDEVVPPWADAVTFLTKPSPVFDRKSQLKFAANLNLVLRSRNANYDVVHLHGTYLLSQTGLIGTGWEERAVLLPVLERGDLATTGSGVAHTLKRLVTRRLVERSLAGFALSPTIADELQGLGMPAKRISPIGNAVSIENHPTAGSSISSLPPTLGFVGKLGSIKRPHLILEAMSRLPQQMNEVRAIFVGPFVSDQYEAEFRARVRILGLADRVNIVGFTTQVESHLREIDVFVLPSSSEGMPGAMAEAMAYSIPTVVTDVGAMGDVVRESGAGVIVDPTPDSVANAIVSLLNNRRNYEAMAAAALAYARLHFSTESVAGVYVNHLRRVLNPTERNGAVQ